MTYLCSATMVAVTMLATAAADVKAGVDAWQRGDFTRAVEIWRPLALDGDADAQFNMAQAYKLGRGVPVDAPVAEEWFRKAAVQGHEAAEINYGLALFQAGRFGEASPWLEKAVARGEPRAQLVLGTMLFNGDGVARDYPRAYALMTRASQAGLPSASATLAQMDAQISPADRGRGIALAAQYARAAPTPAPIGTEARPAPAPVRTAAAAPTAPATPAARTPASRPAAAPAARIAAASPTPSPKPSPTPTPTRSAPAPIKVAAKSPSPHGGAWRIQLGAFRTKGAAEALWASVRPRFDGASPAFTPAGALTRLQVTGYASRAAAQRTCAGSGVSCIVVAP